MDPVTVGEIAEQTEKIFSDWSALGWMYGTIAIIGLLTMLLRFKPIDAWLEKKAWKKYKPYFSAGLGALAAFFTVWAEQGLWPDGVIALAMGAAAGMAAVGGHQMITKSNSK